VILLNSNMIGKGKNGDIGKSVENGLVSNLDDGES